MLTRNAQRLFQAFFFSGGSSVPGINTGGTTDTNALSASSIASTSNVPNIFYCSSSYAQSGIYVGRGRTPATADDFDLEDLITSGLSSSSSSSSVDFINSENKVIKTKILTLTNKGSSPITIGEIATFFYSSGKAYMLDRTVLDEPVTINPGEAKTITYSIEFCFFFGNPVT